ncbi:translocation/assembly module TamB domain-containing protein [Ramlibacter tataouinensis]|uniref:translocation/assembly module TamB domain-containing protein n=1 Tax=Ramlibacter tataouinensis TaxID=94132 RepID=UPI0022F3B4B7|nr:translocation/assembly module TamB domain-containing protein [Ramlibacter tataouinensis]WBY03098.1 translocation/assembly module TamB domain-containing protein [Ramlibacter tataouinensis]
MKALRWMGRGLVLLLVLAVAAAAVLWWWAGREGSAQWALEQAARRLPGLQAGGVTGSLRHGLRVQQLAWRQGGLDVQAQQLELAWEPLALLQGRLALDYLRAARVRVEDRRPDTGQRPQPPASLALPLQVSVDDLAVGRLEWAGPPALVLGELAARYAYDGAWHRLDLRNLRALDGHYRGELRVAAQAPFDLAVHLQGRVETPVPGAEASLPLLFQARADGRLADFDLQAKVQAEPGGSGAAQATLVARVTPWAALPLARARADFQDFDAGALWREAPDTLLSGRIALEPRDASTWAVKADLHNGLAGPWDRQRVPAARVQLEGDWRLPAHAFVRQLDADVGGGKVQARGEWASEQDWRIEGTLAGVNPAAVHSAMAPLPLGGRASVRAEGEAMLFDAELKAAGALQPAPAGGASNEVAAAVGALELRSLQARGRWAGQQLSLPLLLVTTADARLDAAIDLQPAARFGRGRAELQAPGLRLRAVGSLGRTRGGGNAKASLDDVARAQQWLQKLPGVPRALSSPLLAGRAQAQFAWQGGWDDPEVKGTLSVPQLQPVAAAGEAAPWALREATLALDGRLADARIELRAQALQGERRLALELAGRAGRRPQGAWQGQVASLQAQARDPALGPGPWRLALQRPVPLSWSGGRLEAGASQAALAPPPVAGRAVSSAVLAWDPVTWAAGELHTAGRITGLPMAWMELLGGPQLAGSALSGDLVFEGQWDAQLGEQLRLRAALARSSGDVSVLAETVEGGSARVQAGVRQARLTLEGEGEALTAALVWDSERAGTAQAKLVSRLSREGGGWSWPADAPLTGAIQAQLPRLGVWSLLAPPGWRLRGSVQADIAVSGTRADPQLAGSLAADDLALRSVVDGVALRDGRLRARLQGRQLLIEEFVLLGAGPEGGRIGGTGQAGWLEQGLQARLSVQIERLRASTRNDRELTLSGQLSASLTPAALEVRGALQVDRARIVLPDETAPQLGNDVVVRNLPPGVALGREPVAKEGGRTGRRPLALAVTLDLGNDFRVQGRGIQTRLAGALTVSGQSVTEPRLAGVIRTVGGEYQAYGQRLDIERGVLRFTGAIDNPALDILAIRPRLAQRVGVQITGTAQAPFVRLYAEPDLPESEKLAWLVLGRPSAAGGAETALLQSAAVALLQSRAGAGGGGGKGPAALLGLDELGFRRDGAEGPAVTLGKRLGRDLYASYERSLAGTLGTLYVFYDLSQRFTVRLQAGDRVAVDLIMTFAYD